jgi:RNA polymerase sigma factor (sigma-70 family)
MSRSNHTTSSAVVRLFRRAQAGDGESLEDLMRQHDGLVHHIIRRQWGGSLSYGQVLQEGRIGLWRAILRFDPERGMAFSTYAGVAIARRVWDAVRRDRKAQSQVDAAKQALRNGSEPPTPLSLDPLDGLVEQEIEGALGALVAHLPVKQRQIVRAYYGLDGYPTHTLVQLGEHWGCTKQAVQYHLRRALHRLRHPAFSAPLRALLGLNRRQDYLQALGPERGRS